MTMPDVPRVSLLGFVDDEVGRETPAALEGLVTGLARSRSWTGEPPAFVDEVDDAGVRTCGVQLWLTDMRAPGSAAVPAEVDRGELADTRALVDALAEFSGRTGLTIGIEYGGESAGWIEAGEPDRMVREALVGEWARRLGS
jgi:hypothetical protein